MSYEVVKSIVLKDKEGQVWLNSADSSIRPLSFSSWECKGLSEIYQKEGREAVLARIGEDVWNGNLHLYQGNKLCKLFLQAQELLPQGLNFMNFDGKAAGEFLGKAVARLEQDPQAELQEEAEALLALRNDKDYILETAKRTGHSYLGFADVELQKDRNFALEVMKACGADAWADYPAMYADDKGFALEMLRLNGCHYRSLSDRLKADREVIMEAFSEAEGKTYHEHLPDLIPPEAYWKIIDGSSIVLDREFICSLLERCPSMHLSREPMFVNDGTICLKWCAVGKWFPYSVKDVPAEFLREKAFQDVLIGRFEGTEAWEKLVKRFEDKGIVLQAFSFDSVLQDAVERSQNLCPSEFKAKDLSKE